MKIEKENGRTCYLQETAVENIFLNEYMPDAPCEFVKVYLLAQMYAQMGEDVSEEELAKTLMVSVEGVSKAFEYWSKAGIIRKTADGIVFLSLREQLYGNHNEDVITPDSSRRLMNDEKIAAMFSDIEQATKEFLQPGQMQDILGWVTDYGADPQLISAAYKYCAGIGKTNTRYVGTVVKNWIEKNLNTPEEVEEYLETMDQRYAVYRRVMRALGFSRNATEAEKEMISAWMDELGCSVDDIVQACARTTGISNPNINYVDKVLRGKDRKETVTAGRSAVMEFYENLREQARQEAEARRQQVYSAVPEIKAIEDEMQECSMEITRSLFGGGDKTAMQKRLASLEDKRARLLTENNIPIDYMDIRPRCRKCGDTGTLESGERCSCYEEVAEMAARGE